MRGPIEIKIKDTPYALKSPSRFHKGHAHSIQQAYASELESMDNARRVNEKKRKMKEQTFLMKLKEMSAHAMRK